MRYIFFGSPRFAALILEHLIASGIPPAHIVANPDRPAGRKKVITSPPVKALAEKHSIPVSQPDTLSKYRLPVSDDSFDFAVVAAYSKIIPESLLAQFPRGAIGVHPSLLPKYRGASPIQSAVLNGETETGVSLFLMDAHVDHGPVLVQEKIAIGETETYLELHDRLAKISGGLLQKTLPDFLAGKLKPQEQNHAEATATKKLGAEDGYIAPELLEAAQREGGKTARVIFNMIRALATEPGVWTMFHGKRVKLLEAELVPQGTLMLRAIQEEGKTERNLDRGTILR